MNADEALGLALETDAPGGYSPRRKSGSSSVLPA